MFTHRHRQKHLKSGVEIPEGMIYLSDLKEGQRGVIAGIAGGSHAAKRLADLGLSPGAEVEMLSSTFFSGPIQVYVCGSKLVIGRGLASKIIVNLR